MILFIKAKGFHWMSFRMTGNWTPFPSSLPDGRVRTQWGERDYLVRHVINSRTSSIGTPLCSLTFSMAIIFHQIATVDWKKWSKFCHSFCSSCSKLRCDIRNMCRSRLLRSVVYLTISVSFLSAAAFLPSCMWVLSTIQYSFNL